MDISFDLWKETIKAHADINGEGINGRADLTEIEHGTGKFVRIMVFLRGDPTVLKPGLHGVHLHEKGLCETPFTSAGGHFDPGPFGNPDPDENHPYHMGDLPNILIDNQGEGKMEALTNRITLSPGPLCIFTKEGTSVMIHDHEDPHSGGPHGSGVSGGKRLACGVVKKL